MSEDRIIGYVAIDPKNVPYSGSFAVCRAWCYMHMRSLYPSTKDGDYRIIALIAAEEEKQYGPPLKY